jgi:hypothetical protein
MESNMWFLIALSFWTYHFLVYLNFKSGLKKNRFSSPEQADNISATMAYYLKNRRSGYNHIIIGVVSLACKGYLDIFDDNGIFVLYKRASSPDGLPPEEALIFNILFNDRKAVVFGGVDLNILRTELRNMMISPEIKNRFFVSGRNPMYLGTVGSFAFLTYFGAIENHTAFMVFLATTVINFFIYLNLLHSYTEEGENAASYMDGIENGYIKPVETNTYSNIPWSMVFNTYKECDQYFTADNCDWFDAYDKETEDVLTKMVRERNRKDHQTKFISWLFTAMLTAAYSSKVVYAKSRGAKVTQFENPVEKKRKSKQN